jgi:hypothetical protein
MSDRFFLLRLRTVRMVLEKPILMLLSAAPGPPPCSSELNPAAAAALSFFSRLSVLRSFFFSLLAALLLLLTLSSSSPPLLGVRRSRAWTENRFGRLIDFPPVRPPEGLLFLSPGSLRGEETSSESV